MKSKAIAFIPVHLEWTSEQQRKMLIRELARMEFGRTSIFYSSYKKKCRIKDITIIGKWKKAK